MFPDEVLSLVEEKILSNIHRISDVRMTDPEGTNVSFSVPEVVARLWQKMALIQNHLIMYPPMAFRIPFPGLPDVEQFKKYCTPVWETTKGVVAGTASHSGFMPHTTYHIEKGKVVRIEGKGKFADLAREKLEKYKDVQYPGHPEPSYFYFNDIALATTPGFFRTWDIFDTNRPSTLGPERDRAGVIHCGFGCEHVDQKFQDFVVENNAPGLHGNHIHLYFPTYEAKMRDTGEWVKLVDRGRVTAYDDPQVQRLAASYFDPAAIFAYDWVPAVPGVNYKGKYEDYAENPVPTVKKGLAGEL